MKTVLHPKTCEHCGVTFHPKHWHKPVDWAAAQFCGRACSAKSREVPFERTFMERTADMPNGCKEWTGGKDKKGYGRTGPKLGGEVLAHRMSYILAHGPIPEGLHVLHKCDNPPCVNPDHLYVGTNDDNVRDRHERSRWACQRGEQNPRAKLTDDDIRSIRSDARPQDRIGVDYGISQSTVSSIKRRETWAFVD